MNNFNYNNYIGDHMDEPLMINWNDGCNIVELVGMSDKNHIISDNRMFNKLNIKDSKPLIKSPADLTDEELIYIATGYKSGKDLGFYVKESDNKVFKHILKKNECQNDFCILDFSFECGLKLAKFNYSEEWQQILNRLYSLHISLDYDELIKNNKAVRKG